MTIEYVLNGAFAVVAVAAIWGVWHAKAKREPFVRALEYHFQSLDSARPGSKPNLRVVRTAEKHPTPVKSRAASRKR